MGSSGAIITIKTDDFLKNWPVIRSRFIETLETEFKVDIKNFTEKDFTRWQFLVDTPEISRESVISVVKILHDTKLYCPVDLETTIFGMNIYTGDRFPRFKPDLIYIYETDYQDYSENMLPEVIRFTDSCYTSNGYTLDIIWT